MSAPPILRVVIAGAGIAGLTAAIALRQISGVDVQIYERATELRELGQAIAVAPNGLRTLEKLGVEKVLREETGTRGSTEHSQSYRHWKTNELLGKDAPKGPVERKHETARFFRPDLQKMFLEHLPMDAIHLNKRVVEVQVRTEDGVEIIFGDGTEISVDLLIAADGINSGVRKVFAPDFKVPWTGLVAYRGVFDAALVKGIEGLPEDWTQWWSPDKGIIMGYLPKKKFAVVAFRNVDPENPKNQSLMQKTHWDELGDVGVVRDLYQDFNPAVRSVLAVMPYVRVYPNGVGDFLDRVVLIGDAAHAHGGLFAANSSLGIDDSYALYLALQHVISSIPKSKLDVTGLEKALRLYDETRRPHAAKVLTAAHGVYKQTSERVGSGIVETDEMLGERMESRPDASWIHEHNVSVAFEKALAALERKEESAETL